MERNYPRLESRVKMKREICSSLGKNNWPRLEPRVKMEKEICWSSDR